MNKTVSIIIMIIFVLGFGIMFFGQSKKSSDATISTQSSQNVEIRDGVQYVTINARGGYFPRVSTAQENIPTKLIIKTDDTYDCSLSLVIRSIGYKKILPQTGEEMIDLGSPQAGTLQGLCSMGMYNFVINFNKISS